MPLPTIEAARIAVIGLGYVGLPLAVAFAGRFDVLGFDVDDERVGALREGRDETGEVAPGDLACALAGTPGGVGVLRLSSEAADLGGRDVFVVAVPTPIDPHRQPDLGPLIAASELVGRAIAPGGVVVYESTVYPGATEEDCLPVVERVSGLTRDLDFAAGYSPERVSPGDRARPLTRIVKVTSGSTPEAADFVDALYASVVEAGTHKAPSIRVAEAAKVVENTQRDVGIALINELSIVFSHLGIDTAEVLDAAATKWNFNRLSPGLVGGHCIGVDPYYLLQRSIAAGHVPDIIRRSREINDGMARHAAARLVKAMIAKDVRIKRARVLMLGATFKEDCPDIRNTKVADLAAEIEGYGMRVDLHDPLADPGAVRRALGRELLAGPPEAGAYDAVVLAVPHRAYRAMGPAAIRAHLARPGAFFDVKAAFARSESDLRL